MPDRQPSIPAPQCSGRGQLSTSAISHQGYLRGIESDRGRFIHQPAQYVVTVIECDGILILRGKTIVDGCDKRAGVDGKQPTDRVMRFQITKYKPASMDKQDQWTI